MSNLHSCNFDRSRRDFLRSGFFGLGVGAAMPFVFEHSSLAIAAEAFLEGKEAHPERILVVVELSGGNDGLNTVVPFSNDIYRKSRPTLALNPKDVLKLNEELALHPQMRGLKYLWDQGQLAIVHGCGYPNPNRSHFTSMEYWHTARPHMAESLGWIGRFADACWPKSTPNTIVNIAPKQTLAVQSGLHAPVVFYDPQRFVRAGDPSQEPVYQRMVNRQTPQGNQTLSFLKEISATASTSSGLVRAATAKYQTPISYGSASSVATLSTDLRKVAALVAAGFPTRVYYVSQGGFDTHGNQLGTQQGLLMYVADALEGFLKDMKRLGRSQDVAVVMFTEFGRRVAENASGGTDHGTATPMFVLGEKVKGGFYSQYPSLTNLDQGDLKMTTDFRSVYATMIQEWMGYDDTKQILRGDFPTLGVFG